MAYGGSQLDVAHALTADFGACDLNAALIADFFLIAIFDAFILTAAAFPVLHRTKDFFTEQAATLGLKSTVVDRFRFGHFAIGPV